MSRSMLSYNIHDGGVEGTVFGLRNRMIKRDLYTQLQQCETLEDIKQHLQNCNEVDYANFLQDETNLTTKVIMEGALHLFVEQFEDIRANADQPLAKFLDFITYEYQIANVLKMVSGTKNGRDTMDLLFKCHPLGLFEGLRALNSPETIDEIYDIVLIDSDLGQFFERTERTQFDQFNLEYIRSVLHKNYLEHFYCFCRSLGGETWEVMKEILEFEADRFVITLTRNTYGVRDLHKDDRRKMFPAVGHLEVKHDDLATVDDDDALKEVLRSFPDYQQIVDGTSGSMDGGQGTSLDNRFMAKSVEIHKASLAKQFHFGVFYSWLKLKELEVNNLMWICECVVQDMRNRAGEYVEIYE